VSRIWQEFFCGECKGYIRVKLNMSLNHEVEVVCPKCGHKHRRIIVDGEIHEKGRYQGSLKEEICPTLSAWYEEAWTEKMRQARNFSDRRDGVRIKESEVPTGHIQAQEILSESWFSRFGG
jgi:RNase P subunit RPR2